MTQTKILLSVFHPDLESSRANKALLEAVKELPNLSYRDMYLEYDGKFVNTATEEIFLREYDLFVFQYPMYWFNAPTLLAEWTERSLVKGFAYPPSETEALKGKKWMNVVTTAAGAEEYTDGDESASLETLLKPFEMTARYCQMTWLAPWALHDARPEEEGGLTEQALQEKALEYKTLLASL